MQIDGHGIPVQQTKSWGERAVVLSASDSAGRGGHTAHYRLHIPKMLGDKMTYIARRQNYRKVSAAGNKLRIFVSRASKGYN